MSKSKGNVVTPEDIVVAHRADAVRYWAASGRLGTDAAYDDGQIKVGRRLAIKILNASKFALGFGWGPASADAAGTAGSVAAQAAPVLPPSSPPRCRTRSTCRCSPRSPMSSSGRPRASSRGTTPAPRGDRVLLLDLLRRLPRAGQGPGVRQPRRGRGRVGPGRATPGSVGPAPPLRSDAPRHRGGLVLVAGRLGPSRRLAHDRRAAQRGDPTDPLDTGAVLGAIRKAKSDAKVGMRAEVASATVAGPEDALARVRAGEDDPRAAGRVETLEYAEARPSWFATPSWLPWRADRALHRPIGPQARVHTGAEPGANPLSDRYRHPMAQVRWLPARAAAGAVAAAALVLLVLVSRAGSVLYLTLPTARPTVDITGGINPTDAPVPPRINPADADRVADLLRVLLTIGAIIVPRWRPTPFSSSSRWPSIWSGSGAAANPPSPMSASSRCPRFPSGSAVLGAGAPRAAHPRRRPQCGRRVLAGPGGVGRPAGLARQDSDPADYVGDVLARWEVDPAALTELAELYREARFSTHPMTDAHRDRALAASTGSMPTSRWRIGIPPPYRSPAPQVSRDDPPCPAPTRQPPSVAACAALRADLAGRRSRPRRLGCNPPCRSWRPSRWRPTRSSSRSRSRSARRSRRVPATSVGEPHPRVGPPDHGAGRAARPGAGQPGHDGRASPAGPPAALRRPGRAGLARPAHRPPRNKEWARQILPPELADLYLLDPTPTCCGPRPSTATSPESSSCDPSFADVSRTGAAILDQVERAVVGKREALTLALSAILAGGHVLPRGLPRPRQDPGRPVAGPGPRSSVHPGAVHPGPAPR